MMGSMGWQTTEETLDVCPSRVESLDGAFRFREVVLSDFNGFVVTGLGVQLFEM
jgi:hypothetical protein